jgi:hypothetical protein
MEIALLRKVSDCQGDEERGVLVAKATVIDHSATPKHVIYRRLFHTAVSTAV